MEAGFRMFTTNRFIFILIIKFVFFEKKACLQASLASGIHHPAPSL